MKFATSFKSIFTCQKKKTLLKLFVTAVIKQAMLFNCKFLYFIDRVIPCEKKRKIMLILNGILRLLTILFVGNDILSRCEHYYILFSKIYLFADFKKGKRSKRCKIMK